MSCSSIAPSFGAPATASAATTPLAAVLASGDSSTSAGGGTAVAATPDLAAAIQALQGAIGSLRGALEGLAGVTGGGGNAPSSCTQASTGVGQIGQLPPPDPAGQEEPDAPSTPDAPTQGDTPTPPQNGATQAPAGFRLQHPLKGAHVSSGFGSVSAIRNNRPHGGTDLAKPQGSQIQAAAPGKVVQVAMDADGYGNYVTIDHGNGWFTRYAHMVKQSPLEVGDTVAAGQAVGKVGSTGNSTGPHLHFEVLKGGTDAGNRVDAAPYLSGKKTF